MRQLVVVSLIIGITSGCTLVRKSYNGDLYRVDKPFIDSANESRASSDPADIQIDLATLCFPEDREFIPESAASGGATVQPSPTGRTQSGKQASGNEDGTTREPTPPVKPVLRLRARGKDGAPFQCRELAYGRAVVSAIDRDRLQDILMDASDDECDSHLAAVVGTNNNVNLTTGLLASALGLAATVTDPASSKSVLSALSTLFIDTRAQFNEQIYKQLFVGTLLKAIEDDRRAFALEIQERRAFPVPLPDYDPRTKGETSVYLGAQPLSNLPRSRSTTGEPASGTSAGPTSTQLTTATATVPPGPPSEETEPGTTTDEDKKSTEAEKKKEEARREPPKRAFYSADEAIRDAREYHQRCSFYRGLVRVAETVEKNSPCRLLEERRERLFAELANSALDSVRRNYYTQELEGLKTKLNNCATVAQR